MGNPLILGGENVLAVVKRIDFGYYLDGGPLHPRLLLPNGEITFDGLPQEITPAEALPHEGDTVPTFKRGQRLRVFLYLDQQERLVATMRRPKAQVGDTALLACVWTNKYGAFLDWGLMKDLFVPYGEQVQRMEQGRSYRVRVLLDETTHRIYGSAKGFATERDDDPQERLLDYLRAHGGLTTLSDHSAPADIEAELAMSKKTFKRAAGELYRRRLILLTDEGLRLVE